MKTKNTSKRVGTFCSILLSIMMPVMVSAQITNPYPINNNTGCNVNIDFSYYDSNCNFISSSTGQNVPPAGLALNPPGNAFDIEIIVNFINAASCVVTQNNNPVNSILTGGACMGVSSSVLSHNNSLSCGACTISSISLIATSALIQ